MFESVLAHVGTHCAGLCLSRLLRLPTWSTAGSWRSFSVCPVGAVSKTIVSYVPDSIRSTTLRKRRANRTTIGTSVARSLQTILLWQQVLLVYCGMSSCSWVRAARTRMSKHTHARMHARTHTHTRARTLTQPARLGASLANLVQHLHCDVMRHAAMHYVVCRTSRAQWLRLCQGFL